MAKGQKTAALSQEEALRFWHQVVDPKGIGMAESIASEIASYTGEEVSEVLQKMATGKEQLKQLWDASLIDVADPASVTSFYRDNFVEAYELANWHCGRENGTPPLNYAYAAQFAKKEGLRRVLDFGSGIGTGSLCFASVGCEVHSADIACELLKLVEHRFRLRGFHPVLINLSAGETVRQGHYDLITCFDVLEHVSDQLAKLRELRSYLRSGGYLFVNLTSDSHHEDRPMHISSAGNVLSLIRQSDLVPDWNIGWGESSALVRRPFARLYNYAATWKDWMQGA